MSAQCASCGRDVSHNHENRLPPWCPHCGGDLKPKEAAVLVGAQMSQSPSGSLDRAPSAWEARPAAPQVPTVEDAGPVPHLDDLGDPEAAFRGSGWRRLLAWGLALVCFGLVAAIGYGVLHQPDKNPAGGIGLMVLFAAGGFGCAYMALTLGGLSYLVYPRALVQRRGGQSTVIPWSHIREVTQTIHVLWKKYRIRARGGIDIQLTGDIKNHVTLGSKIEEKVVECLLPGALAQLDAGETIQFGALGVNRAGIYAENELSPWPHTALSIGLQMDRVNDPTHAKLMYLHVYTHGRAKSFKVEVGQIPNFCLLLELVRQNAPQCLPVGM